MAVTSRAPFDAPPITSADQYLIVLVNGGRFERLLRKDDLLDEGVAAIFGLAGGEAELVGISFSADKFAPSLIAAWLAERRFTPLADVLIVRSCPRR
jgi:hypothetical protein